MNKRKGGQCVNPCAHNGFLFQKIPAHICGRIRCDSLKFLPWICTLYCISLPCPPNMDFMYSFLRHSLEAEFTQIVAQDTLAVLHQTPRENLLCGLGLRNIVRFILIGQKLFLCIPKMHINVNDLERGAIVRASKDIYYMYIKI